MAEKGVMEEGEKEFDHFKKKQPIFNFRKPFSPSTAGYRRGRRRGQNYMEFS
jgi:hypothetical protein